MWPPNILFLTQSFVFCCCCFFTVSKEEEEGSEGIQSYFCIVGRKTAKKNLESPYFMYNITACHNFRDLNITSIHYLIEFQ